MDLLATIPSNQLCTCFVLITGFSWLKKCDGKKSSKIKIPDSKSNWLIDTNDIKSLPKVRKDSKTNWMIDIKDLNS